jgi:hypothetical protein
MDRKFAECGGDMTDLDSRTYLSWVNAFGRHMVRLGLKAPSDRKRGLTLAEILAAER